MARMGCVPPKDPVALTNAMAKLLADPAEAESLGRQGGVGMTEPTPDWGLMFLDSVRNYQNDLTYLLFPGLSLTIFSVAFSLFGDAIRDALDPKTIR